MAERTSFGRYEVKGSLGRGGMGAVYLGHDPRFQRDVAIKVLDKQLGENPRFHERFDREARAIALLEHSAIVPVYDYGKEDGEPYLVFRVMEGGTLAQRTARGPLPLEDVARIVARIAGALDYAHARGVIHRDIKPANILFDNLGEAWLTDFGIARMTGEASALTGTSLVGSPDYMAPEQGEGKPATAASDIYGLACTAYEALSGHPPFSGETPVLTLLKHMKEDAPPLASATGGLPASADDAVRRAMSKNPAARPPTATDFALELAAAAGVSIAPAAGTGPLPPPRSSTSERTSVFGATAPTAGGTVATAPPGKVATGRAGGRRVWPVLVGAVLAVLVVSAVAAGLLLAGGSGDDKGTSEEVAGPPEGRFRQVSAGGFHACALDPADALRCWGANAHGQSNPPAGRFRSVSAGEFHSCAVRDDQSLVCWGDNESDKASPPAGQFLQVSAGATHSCARRTDMRIVCWGAGAGNPPDGTFDSIAAGVGLNCGITTRAMLACWGEEAANQTRPNALEFEKVAVGAAHGCSITRMGQLLCLSGSGGNSGGQTDSPQGTFKEVSGGATHSCAIKSDDTLVCWGTSTATGSPPAPPRGTFSGLSTFASGHRNCALQLSSGEIACWD